MKGRQLTAWLGVGLIWIALFGSAPLIRAAPVWRAPVRIQVGELVEIDIVETDPTAPPLPRPAEEKLGALLLRSAVPLVGGRGWRLTVQAFRPGQVIVRPVDLGQGRLSQQLRIEVARTVPYGAPWMGLGGGGLDIPPRNGFPWAWATLCFFPPCLFLSIPIWFWRRSAPSRRLSQAKRAFAAVWPPCSLERGAIDQAHAKGRELMAIVWGEEARSWGGRDFLEHDNAVWASWCSFMDAARFGEGSQEKLGVPPTRAELIELLGGKR